MKKYEFFKRNNLYKYGELKTTFYNLYKDDKKTIHPFFSFDGRFFGVDYTITLGGFINHDTNKVKIKRVKVYLHKEIVEGRTYIYTPFALLEVDEDKSFSTSNNIYYFVNEILFSCGISTNSFIENNKLTPSYSIYMLTSDIFNTELYKNIKGKYRNVYKSLLEDVDISINIPSIKDYLTVPHLNLPTESRYSFTKQKEEIVEKLRVALNIPKIEDREDIIIPNFINNTTIETAVETATVYSNDNVLEEIDLEEGADLLNLFLNYN
jgi:hypothetical protein